MPLSVPFLIVALGIYGWFAAALGVWISLQLRSTWRAQFLTMACLLLDQRPRPGMLNMLSRFGFAPQLWPGSRRTRSASWSWMTSSSSVSRAAMAPILAVSTMDDSLAWQDHLQRRQRAELCRVSQRFLTWHTLRRFEIVAGRAQPSHIGSPL